jgi:hypothetical protein
VAVLRLGDPPPDAEPVRLVIPQETWCHRFRAFGFPQGHPGGVWAKGELRALHDPPDEIEVEFGLKMSAEAGAVVAATGLEANYRVTLTWRREETRK